MKYHYLPLELADIDSGVYSSACGITEKVASDVFDGFSLPSKHIDCKACLASENFRKDYLDVQLKFDGDVHAFLEFKKK